MSSPTPGNYLGRCYQSKFHHSLKGEITGLAGSQTFNALGVGQGLRVKLTKELFMQAELEAVNYASEESGGDSLKVKSTAGKVALGYRF